MNKLISVSGEAYKERRDAIEQFTQTTNEMTLMINLEIIPIQSWDQVFKLY